MAIQEQIISSNRYFSNFKFVTWASNCRTSTIWWIIFILASTLYGLTAQTSVAWQDSGTFQWRILIGDYVGTFGLVCAHPMLILLGQIAKLIPIGNILWRINFISGLGMAIALANFMALVTLITNNRKVAVLFTVILGFSHLVWWIATIVESYTWVVAGLTLELWLLVKLIRDPRWSLLVLLAFVNGLTFSFHDFATLTLPVYVLLSVYLVWKKQIPVWSLGLASVAFLIGGALFISLIVCAAVESGNIVTAISSALFGPSRGIILNTSLITPYTRANAALASLSFMNIILPLAVVGVIRFRKDLVNILALALGAITFIEIVFIIRLGSEDQFSLMLPAMTVISLASAIGASYLVQISNRWRQTVMVLGYASVICMPLIYGFLPSVLRGLGVEVQRTRMLPFRDEMRYFITPWRQNEKSAQLFSETALHQAAPEGIIIGDNTTRYPLLITRLLNSNMHLAVIQLGGKPLPSYDSHPEKFRQLLGDRPLYIVSPIPGYINGFDKILHDAEVQKRPGEVIYRVFWKKTQNEKEN